MTLSGLATPGHARHRRATRAVSSGSSLAKELPKPPQDTQSTVDARPAGDNGP